MTYAVVFKRSVAKDMRHIPRIITARIEEEIHGLADEPFPANSRKLLTAEGNLYRLRVGQYRVIYEVTHEIRIITIMRVVGHRGSVYRML